MLKVKWVAIDHPVPAEPEKNTKASEKEEERCSCSSLRNLPLLQKRNNSSKHEDTTEECPTIVPRDCRAESTCASKNKVAGFLCLNPAYEKVNSHYKCYHIGEFAHGSRLKVKNIRIESKYTCPHKTRCAILCESSCSKKCEDIGQHIARHCDKCTSKTCSPEIIIPDERPHQNMRERKPYIT